MEIRQHIPAFVSGIDPGRARFASRAELLAVPFVQSWSQDPGFHRFSVHDEYTDDTALLMAERDGGSVWYVVGYLDARDTAALDLPKWVNPPRAAP